MFGDGSALGKRIHYVVEEPPLGTGGGVKNAEPHLDDLTIVFNGDVLTTWTCPAIVQAHRGRGRGGDDRADAGAEPVRLRPRRDGRGAAACQRFVEKPEPSQITTNTINAGIYVLETATLGADAAGRQLLDRARVLPRAAAPR